MKTKGREQIPITLGFVNLDLAKAAVQASLRSPGSRRCYEHAITEFIGCLNWRHMISDALVRVHGHAAPIGEGRRRSGVHRRNHGGG
jgi:hypothetical protein